MRLSLTSASILGLTVLGIYMAARPPELDSRLLTGALVRVDNAPGSAPAPLMFSGKGGRLMADAGDAEPPPVAEGQAAEPAGVSEAAPAAPPAVDESALRYFAAQGDKTRLEAEIARLKALYPHWTTPADPLNIPVESDARLDALWTLYTEGRFADIRKALAERQAAEPQWQPPADLLERLQLAEARAALVAASRNGESDAVVAIAADNPALLTCAETDILWRLASAFFATGKAQRSADAYAYVLDNCDDAALRYATLQKASEDLPAEMLEKLLARERPSPGGEGEFEPLRDDIARRLVAEANADARLVVAPAYLERLEKRAATDAEAALLLGWYHYRRDRLQPAETFFRKAVDREQSAASAEGLALTLIARDAPREAEAVLYPWRASSQGTIKAYLAAVANLLANDPPPLIPEELLGRMAPEVLSARDVEAAQQFGWYARAFGQSRTSAEWFGLALSWRHDHEPSAYGLALALHDLGDTAGIARIQAQWAGRSVRIENLMEDETQRRRLPQADAALSRQALPEPAVNAAARPSGVARNRPATPAQPQPRRRQPPDAASATRSGNCWTSVDPGRLSPSAALQRGWCLLEINRPLEAAQSFEAAGSSADAQERSDAAYGRSLSFLRAGLADRAAVAAAAAPQANARAVELQSAILSEQAVNAFQRGRYRETLVTLDRRAAIAPEQSDLLVLRAYSHMHLGRTADARRIFQALADTGNREGQRGLAALSDR